ncbi:MAG TPA: hypothetical protein VF784_12900 [Anaerolineales bacterium]
MAQTIVCQVCGEINPADMEFCSNCQSRLKPLEGALKGESAPIQPGELPTKKVTSELEPLLPQWLRDARQQARDSLAGDVSSNRLQEEAPQASSSPDLLAGLASQKDEEEEDIPEWLAQITGAQARKKKAVPEESQVKWVELGRREEPQVPESPQPANTQNDELTDWSKQATASPETADFPLPPEPVTRPVFRPGEETAPEPMPPPDGGDLAWLKHLDAAAPPAVEQPPREEAPDWLRKLQAEQTAQEPPKPAAVTPPPFQGDVPDWLKGFGEQTPVQVPVKSTSAEQPAPPAEALPDWLQGGGPLTEEPAPAEPKPDQAVTAALPDWVSALGKPQEEAQAGIPESPAEEAPASAVPDSAAGLENPPTPMQGESQPGSPQLRAEEPAIPVPAAPSETPDWLASLRQESEAPQAGLEPAASAGAEQPAAQAFTGESLAGNDADAIFASMQAPDWLSSVLPAQPETAQNNPAAPQEEPIAPAELPSWVQAMRPVESAISTAAGAGEDVATERLGPLAGLQGVLPALPDAAVPSSKPRSQSLKLDANEQQQAHAALLDQILAAETSPIPVKSAGALLRTQKALRWGISALLILVLGAVVYTRTQVFELPTGVPNETVGAIQAVEAIPADAPVLAVFDYQPSTVGEMEASGGSLMDHLLLLKHPKLVLLSTSPTGAALAERFMSTTLADRAYARNVQYVNLGYLPGGLAGVYNFAQSPRATVPLDFDARPAWESAILGPVQRFSDFAAIIVLTDSLESGRTWVEQTQTSRGGSLMVIVASAQAGPMLLPYFESGQVSGIISGIYGAVAAEQRNAGSPGFVRRYWDAYSVGLYMAVVLIALGALWSLWRGIQDRRAGTVG